MNPTSAQLQRAVAAGILSPAQATELFQFLQHDAADGPWRRRAGTVLLYLGGFVAIAALSLFITVAWERVGGAGLLALAVVYGLAGWAMTEWLWRSRKQAAAVGLAATLTAAVVPLGVYGLWRWLGWWPDPADVYTDLFGSIATHWVSLETIALVVTALLLRRYPVPLLMLPLGVMAWFLVLDLSAAVTLADAQVRQGWVSAGLGAVLLIAARLLEQRPRSTALPGDFSFWWYLLGSAAVFVGATLLLWDEHGQHVAYLAVSVALMGLGTWVKRRAPLVFGALGVAWLLGDWAYDRFADSLWFPIVLSLTGLALAAAGVAGLRRTPAAPR